MRKSILIELNLIGWIRMTPHREFRERNYVLGKRGRGFYLRECYGVLSRIAGNVYIRVGGPLGRFFTSLLC